MLTVHLEENTYAVVNEAGQALLIDPGADAWVWTGLGQGLGA